MPNTDTYINTNKIYDTQTRQYPEQTNSENIQFISYWDKNGNLRKMRRTEVDVYSDGKPSKQVNDKLVNMQCKEPNNVVKDLLHHEH